MELGFALILAGIALVLAAALLLAFSVAQGGAAGVGGCVIVLFVPICFGVGPLAPYLLIAALALAVALVALSILLWKWVLSEARRVAQAPESSSR